ncbi:MAG: hypothetical protein V4636_07520 [Pseudomonadota bacterium]
MFSETAAAMSELMASLLRTGGMPHALNYLNGRVPHRFTALYRLEGDRLRNVFLQDKAGIRPLFLQNLPLDGSYCRLAIRDGSFSTDDASHDRRLAGHPLQDIVLCYHSVPVCAESGEMLGTVSHFDVERCASLNNQEFEFLHVAARLLRDHMGQPGTTAGG